MHVEWGDPVDRDEHLGQIVGWYHACCILTVVSIQQQEVFKLLVEVSVCSVVDWVVQDLVDLVYKFVHLSTLLKMCLHRADPA